MHLLSPLISTNNIVAPYHIVPSGDWFRSTLRTIKCIYSKFISIEELESYYYENKKFNNCCHICFDDGDRTFYENAFPVLKEHNIPATLFVSPKVISEESNYWFQELSYIRNIIDDAILKETICQIFNCRYDKIEKYTLFSIFTCMKLKDILKVISLIKERHNIEITQKYNITKDEFFELNDSKIIKIGAHTMNHPILSNESLDMAEKEIRESVEGLSKMLGEDIKYFAYPNGITGLDYSAREQTLLQENRIRLAFTMDMDFFNKKTNPLSIPRGGYPSPKGQKKARILGRLFFLPIWQSAINLIRCGRVESEVKERKELKGLAIF